MKAARHLLYGLAALVVLAIIGGGYALSTMPMERLVYCSTEDEGWPPPFLCLGYLKLARLDPRSIGELQAGAGLDGVLNSQGDRRYDVARLLLDHGLDVDGVNHHGIEGGERSTPLQAAIHYNDAPRVEFLLRHGADKRLEDSQGRDALALAEHLRAQYPDEERTALLEMLKR